MAYTKTVWQDRQVTFPLRFTQTLVSGTTYDLVPAEGTVITSGTPINATNLNNIENGIETLDLGKVNKSGDSMTGILTVTTGGGQFVAKSNQVGMDGNAYMEFKDSAGSRYGFVGKGNSANNNIIIYSDLGDVELYTASGSVKVSDDLVVTGNIQEGGTNLTSKYVRLNGSNNMTGDLWITKVSPAFVFDDTDALGTRCAITNYQSKLSFRYGANSTTNEMMYLDGVTGLTFKSNLAFTGASTIGQSGIHMKNSDIVGVNGLYLGDEAQAEGEGFNFPKTGATSGSTTQSDYNCLRVDGSGRMKLDGNVIARTDVGAEISNITTNKIMMAADTVTMSVNIADCPNGWMVEWRNQTGTAFIHYTPIYKFMQQGSVTMHDCGSNNVGNPYQKVLTIGGSGTTLIGSDSNDDAGAGGVTGGATARVMSAVYIF